MNTALTEVGEFFNAWVIYRKVLANNYMHHKEIYEAVTRFIEGQWETRPFKLLDLGCGDARFIAGALKGRAIEFYTGFDLSDPALDLAAKNISPLGCKIDLLNIDFMDGMAKTKAKFDIVFISYALHHLTQAEKAKFFRLAHSLLTENGLLLVIDLMREPSETLPVFLDNYCQWVKEEWLRLDEDEMTAIIQHIRDNDMPETETTLSALAEVENFSPGTSLYQLPMHQFLYFRKNHC